MGHTLFHTFINAPWCNYGHPSVSGTPQIQFSNLHGHHQPSSAHPVSVQYHILKKGILVYKVFWQPFKFDLKKQTNRPSLPTMQCGHGMPTAGYVATCRENLFSIVHPQICSTQPLGFASCGITWGPSSLCTHKKASHKWGHLCHHSKTPPINFYPIISHHSLCSPSPSMIISPKEFLNHLLCCHLILCHLPTVSHQVAEPQSAAMHDMVNNKDQCLSWF